MAVDLPTAFADFGPAQLAAAVIAAYLVVGEPFVGYVLHRRFEGRLRTDSGARRSFYRRLLILEWGLAVLAMLVWLSAPGVDAGQVGLRWPTQWRGVLASMRSLPRYCRQRKMPRCANSKIADIK